MRFADYIVSYSLQINNRCLRCLADSRGVCPDLPDLEEANLSNQPVFAESMLLRDSRRLTGMWRFVKPWTKGHEALAAHTQRLFAVTEQLHQSSAPARLALRMASQAVEDEDGKDLLMLARGLPRSAGIEWGYLSEIFSEDSAWWRDTGLFRQVVDEDLARLVAKDYRRAFKLVGSEKLNAPADTSSSTSVHPSVHSSVKALTKLGRLSEQTAHRLELLRPGLSDKGKRLLWYLEKLAEAHRTRDGLALLQSQIGSAGLRKQVEKRCRLYVAQQAEKIDKRIRRLGEASYDLKPKRFNGLVWQAFKQLNLGSVTHIDRGTARVSAVHVTMDGSTDTVQLDTRPDEDETVGRNAEERPARGALNEHSAAVNAGGNIGKDSGREVDEKRDG